MAKKYHYKSKFVFYNMLLPVVYSIQKKNLSICVDYNVPGSRLDLAFCPHLSLISPYIDKT